MKVLLWQASVATGPHVFVIATCIRSELIIYLLVSCNKQFFYTSLVRTMFSVSIHVPFGEREKHTATSKDKRERRTREARETHKRSKREENK